MEKDQGHCGFFQYHKRIYTSSRTLVFDHLNTLEISCVREEGDTTNRRHKRTQALIKVIHNAPSLKKLILRYSAIQIADLERLHAAATKLKYLEFDDAVI